MTLETLCHKLAGTHVASTWEALLELYATVDAQCNEFQRHYHVHCPPGCGTCCEHFVPEITQAEASLIAAYILFVANRPDVIESLARQEGHITGCPLYRPDSEYHCTVYPARALICRLFGGCPSEDKHGQPVFRKCKYNSELTTPSVLHPEDFIQNGHPVVTMRSFGLQLDAISSTNAVTSIGEAVVAAAQRLLFIVANSDMGPDMPEPDAPAPIAS